MLDFILIWAIFVYLIIAIVEMCTREEVKDENYKWRD